VSFEFPFVVGIKGWDSDFSLSSKLELILPFCVFKPLQQAYKSPSVSSQFFVGYTEQDG